MSELGLNPGLMVPGLCAWRCGGNISMGLPGLGEDRSPRNCHWWAVWGQAWGHSPLRASVSLLGKKQLYSWARWSPRLSPRHARFPSLRGQTVPRHQEHTPFSFTYRLCIHREMPEQLTCWQVVSKEAGITYSQWVYMMDPLPSFHLISKYVLSTLCTRHCALLSWARWA